MSYQPYMNMGFPPPGATTHPYMMGFQGGMPMPMPQQSPPVQYSNNHRPQAAAGGGMSNVNMHMNPHPPMQNKVNMVGGGSQQSPSPNMGGMGGGAPQGMTPNSGKRKMNNDPNRPKRPTSAYFFFVHVEREEAARRGEKITRVAEWTKAVSAKWRELTAEEKEQYQQMAASDKARYNSQMAAYTGKDANRPKRPQSAYFLWLADFRARMKDKFSENKEILRAAGEEWRKMTTVEKAPYEHRAEEERKKYEQAMKEYNISGGSAAAKRARVEEAQRDAKSAAEAVNQSISSIHAQQQQQQQVQQIQQLQQLQQQASQQQQQQMSSAAHMQLQQLQHMQQLAHMQQLQQLQQQQQQQHQQHNSSGSYENSGGDGEGEDDGSYDEDDDE